MERVLFLSVLVCMVGSMNWKHKSTLNLSILTFILRKLVLLAETRQQQLPKQILLKSVNYEVNMNTEHMQMLHGVNGSPLFKST